MGALWRVREPSRTSRLLAALLCVVASGGIGAVGCGSGSGEVDGSGELGDAGASSNEASVDASFDAAHRPLRDAGPDASDGDGGGDAAVDAAMVADAGADGGLQLTTGFLRAANLVADHGGPISICVGPMSRGISGPPIETSLSAFSEGLPYEGVSAYAHVEGDPYALVEIFDASDVAGRPCDEVIAPFLAAALLYVRDGSFQTAEWVGIEGPASICGPSLDAPCTGETPPALFVLTDDGPAPPAGNATIRLVDACPNADLDVCWDSDGSGPSPSSRIAAVRAGPGTASRYETVSPVIGGTIELYTSTVTDTCATRTDPAVASFDVPLGAPAGMPPSGVTTIPPDSILSLFVTGWAGPSGTAHPLAILPIQDGP